MEESVVSGRNTCAVKHKNDFLNALSHLLAEHLRLDRYETDPLALKV
jgi:hypothetical protein